METAKYSENPRDVESADRTLRCHRAMVGLMEGRAEIEVTDEVVAIFESAYGTRPVIRLKRLDSHPSEPGNYATYGIVDCRTNEWKFSSPQPGPYANPIDSERINALERVVTYCAGFREYVRPEDVEFLLSQPES